MDEDANDKSAKTDKKPVMVKNYRKYVSRISWPLKVLIVLIIIAAGILIGRSVHHHLRNNQSTTAQMASSSQASSNSNQKSSNSSSTKPSTSASSASQVPNTGPGDVVAVFLGASFVGGASRYIFVRRKNT